MHLYKDTVAKWLSRLLLAAILILVGWFSIMTIRDYGRESGAARQTLLEKGSVLIRALESGTRVGMGMRISCPAADATGGNGRTTRRAMVCRRR